MSDDFYAFVPQADPLAFGWLAVSLNLALLNSKALFQDKAKHRAKLDCANFWADLLAFGWLLLAFWHERGVAERVLGAKILSILSILEIKKFSFGKNHVLINSPQPKKWDFELFGIPIISNPGQFNSNQPKKWYLIPLPV